MTTFTIPNHLFVYAGRASRALHTAFPFKLAPNGEDFWKDIERRLRDYANRKKTEFNRADHTASRKHFIGMTHRPWNCEQSLLFKEFNPKFFDHVDRLKCRRVEESLGNLINWNCEQYPDHKFLQRARIYCELLSTTKIYHSNIIPQSNAALR